MFNRSRNWLVMLVFQGFDSPTSTAGNSVVEAQKGLDVATV